MTQGLQATDGVLERVEARLPEGFPARVFETMTHGLKRSAALMARMPTQ